MNARRFFVAIVSAILLTATVFIVGVGQEQSELTLSKKNESSSAEVATLQRRVKSLETNAKTMQERLTNLEKIVGNMSQMKGSVYTPQKK
jgi:chaperonin cofactor prefoldin